MCSTTTVQMSSSLNAEIHLSEHYCFLKSGVSVVNSCSDMTTAQRLELVVSRGGSDNRSSLLGILDHCSTASGKRSLRANILQPPTCLTTINSRLLSVTELAQSPALLHSLQVSAVAGSIPVKFQISLAQTINLSPLHYWSSEDKSVFFAIVHQSLIRGSFQRITTCSRIIQMVPCVKIPHPWWKGRQYFLPTAIWKCGSSV